MILFIKRILFIFLTGLTINLSGQTIEMKNEAGVFLGGSNYIGDIGSTTYISPNNLAIGLVYKRYFNKNQAVRFNIMYSQISDADSRSSQDYRKLRDFHFSNKILETSLVYEHSFFDFNPDITGSNSLYAFGGIGLFWYKKNHYTVNHSGGNKTSYEIQEKSKKELNIPFGLGYKYKINDRFVISAEVGARYTMTDNLDNSLATESNFSIIKSSTSTLDDNTASKLENDYFLSKRFGNLKSNDWYVFSGFTLTYTFGRPPCYHCEDAKKRRKKWIIF